MIPDIQISVEQGIVRLTYCGSPQYEFISEKLREAGRIVLERLSGATEGQVLSCACDEHWGRSWRRDEGQLSHYRITKVQLFLASR